MLGCLKLNVPVMQGAWHVMNRPSMQPDNPVVFDMDDAEFHLPLRSSARCPMWRWLCLCRRFGVEGQVFLQPMWSGQAMLSWIAYGPSGTVPVGGCLCAKLSDDLCARGLLGAWDYRRHRRVSPGGTFRRCDRRPGDDPSFVDTFRVSGMSARCRPISMPRTL